jgi:hypothetical protein
MLITLLEKYEPQRKLLNVGVSHCYITTNRVNKNQRRRSVRMPVLFTNRVDRKGHCRQEDHIKKNIIKTLDDK